MMSRNLLSLLLVVLFIGTSLQQAKPITPTCSTTNGDNSIVLKYLQDNGVQINTVPTVSVEIGKGILDRPNIGSCCNPESLKKFIQKKIGYTLEKWKRVAKICGKLKSKLFPAVKRLSQKFNKKSLSDKLNELKRNPIAAQKFREASLMVPSTDAQIENFKKTLASLEDHLENYKKYGAECFKTMVKARSNMIAGMCAGDSGLFTNIKNGNEINFKINAESCTAVTNACFPVWKFNFIVRSVVKYVMINSNRGKGDKAEDKVKKEIELSDTHLEQLKESIDSCSFDAATMKVNCDITAGSNLKIQDHINRLCGIGLTINKPNAYTEGDESVGDFEETETESAEKETLLPDVKIEVKINARVMQTASPTDSTTMGIEVASDGTTFNALNSEGTGVIADASMDTSSAGNDDQKSGKMISLSFFALVAVLALLF